jgi:hypothetical protein
MQWTVRSSQALLPCFNGGLTHAIAMVTPLLKPQLTPV